MKGKLNWFGINAVFAIGIYFGFIGEIEGAYRIVMFLAWVNIIFSFFALADPVIEKMKERGRSVPSWLNITYDLAIAFVFVWFGAWVTGGFWLLHIFLQEAAWIKALEADET